MATVLELIPQRRRLLGKVQANKNPWYSRDHEALAHDWKNVGGYLQRSIKTVEKEGAKSLRESDNK